MLAYNILFAWKSLPEEQTLPNGDGQTPKWQRWEKHIFDQKPRWQPVPWWQQTRLWGRTVSTVMDETQNSRPPNRCHMCKRPFPTFKLKDTFFSVWSPFYKNLGRGQQMKTSLLAHYNYSSYYVFMSLHCSFKLKNTHTTETFSNSATLRVLLRLNT